jgi:TRAP-type transport system small permease protein
VLCALILFAMMMLTFSDVILRYVFSKPIGGAYDLTQVMLLGLVFGSLPIVSLRGMHITTDMIDRLLSQRTRRAVARAVHVLWITTLLALARLVWIKAGVITEAGDTTQTLELKLGPVVYGVAILLAATALVHIAQLVASEPELAGAQAGPL